MVRTGGLHLVRSFKAVRVVKMTNVIGLIGWELRGETAKLLI